MLCIRMFELQDMPHFCNSGIEAQLGFLTFIQFHDGWPAYDCVATGLTQTFPGQNQDLICVYNMSIKSNPFPFIFSQEEETLSVT